MYAEHKAAKSKRVAEEAAAAARQKEAEASRLIEESRLREAEAKRQVIVVSSRAEAKVEIVSTYKQAAPCKGGFVCMFLHEDTYVMKQKCVRRVDTLGSGMEVFGVVAECWCRMGRAGVSLLGI